MKFPKTIPVMGKDYNLITATELDSDGLCDNKAYTITIRQDNTISEPEVLHSLVHELGHALMHRTGITQGLSEGLEEAIVQSYANLFTELFAMKLKVMKKAK